MLDSLLSTFTAQWGGTPTLVGRAPGRVNLIGEHTDYNAGWALPVAIDRAVLIAARPRPDRLIRMWAMQFEAGYTLDLDKLSPTPRGWWTYVAGVAGEIERSGRPLPGADLVINGDVPTGSGLSSSAALEMAAAVLFAALGGHEIDGVERAQIGKRTENEWIGLQSGIMDQMISALGERDHALLVDCRDYTTTPIPLPAAVRIVVCDSKQSRQLAHSAYNQRRSECETAVQLLQAALPSIQTLRDVSEAQLAAHAALLPPVIGQRARHVISENARVLQGVAALRRGDLLTFGRLMNEAHRSLRDDYAVSSVALDTLVAAAQAVPGVYGSRLTGAGFGGCTVSLVAPDAVETFRHAVSAAYEAALGIQPDIYVCRASAGARATHQLDDDDLA